MYWDTPSTNLFTFAKIVKKLHPRDLLYLIHQLYIFDIHLIHQIFGFMAKYFEFC